MRAKLIFKALDQNRARKKDAFFTDVVALFVNARLKPMAPHIN